jgi:predicted nucleic acid-binding Zn ribbon protein
VPGRRLADGRKAAQLALGRALLELLRRVALSRACHITVGESPDCCARGLAGRSSAKLIVPVYVYRRRDGSSFELEQRITVDALVRCPTTGQAVERVLQPFTPHYRGTGFYATDHHDVPPPPTAKDGTAPRQATSESTGAGNLSPRSVYTR